MTRLERLEPSEEALFNDVGAEACRVTQSRRAGSEFHLHALVKGTEGEA